MRLNKPNLNMRPNIPNAVSGSFYHPILNRFHEFGADELVKAEANGDADGWYEISAQSDKYLTIRELLKDEVVASVVNHHPGSSDYQKTIDEALYAMKAHYVKKHFGVDLPETCKNGLLEVYFSGINFDQKLYNLADPVKRRKSMALLTNTKEQTFSDVEAHLRFILNECDWEADPRIGEACRKALAGHEPPLPKINIKCVVEHDNKGVELQGTTYLKVIKVEQEDDGSFTAITDHWPNIIPIPSEPDETTV